MLDILTMVKMYSGAYDLDHSNLITVKDGLERENRKTAITRTPKFDCCLNEFFYRVTHLLVVLPAIDTTKPIRMKAKVLWSLKQHSTQN